MTKQIWWHFARASGLVAWVLLAVAMCMGLFAASRLMRGRGVPAWSTEVHRFTSGAAVVFTLGHVGSLVADSYVHFSWKEVLVPFASQWKPGPVAWGITAAWLLLAVQITSLLRNRLKRTTWRRVHSLSFALFAAAAFHTMTAGSDARNPFVIGVNLAVFVVTTWLVFYRILTARSLGAMKVNPPRAVVVRRSASTPAPVVADEPSLMTGRR